MSKPRIVFSKGESKVLDWVCGLAVVIGAALVFAGGAYGTGGIAIVGGFIAAVAIIAFVLGKLLIPESKERRAQRNEELVEHFKDNLAETLYEYDLEFNQSDIDAAGSEYEKEISLADDAVSSLIENAKVGFAGKAGKADAAGWRSKRKAKAK